jgi:hypothetical protein
MTTSAKSRTVILQVRARYRRLCRPPSPAAFFVCSPDRRQICPEIYHFVFWAVTKP